MPKGKRVNTAEIAKRLTNGESVTKIAKALTLSPVTVRRHARPTTAKARTASALPASKVDRRELLIELLIAWWTDEREGRGLREHLGPTPHAWD